MKFYIKLNLIVLTLLLSCSSALAWEQSFEGHSKDLPTNYFSGMPIISQEHGHAIREYLNIPRYLNISQGFDGYLGMTASNEGTIGTVYLNLQLYDVNGLKYFDGAIGNTSDLHSQKCRYEWIADSTGISVYRDGVFITSSSYITQKHASPAKISLYITLSGTGATPVLLDDFSSTSAMIGCDSSYASTETGQYYRVGYEPFAGLTWYTKIHSPSGNTIQQAVNLSEHVIPASFINESGTYMIILYQNDDSGHGFPMARRSFSYTHV